MQFDCLHFNSSIANIVYGLLGFFLLIYIDFKCSEKQSLIEWARASQSTDQQ